MKRDEGPFVAVPISLLEHQLQPKLDLTRRCLGCIDNTSTAHLGAVGIKQGVVVQGRGEVCMVEDVEELCAELNIEVFGYRIVLEQREIQVDEARSIERISAAISEQGVDRSATCCRALLCRHRKALQLDVIIRISGINRRSTSRTGQPIGIGERVGIVEAKGIAADQNCKWRS